MTHRWIAAASLLFFVSNGVAGTVRTGQVILLASKCAPASCVRYGSVKILEQPESADGSLKYEWMSLPKNSSVIQIQPQNFKAGTKTTAGRFGIGFEGHRLYWKASQQNRTGEVHPPEVLFNRPQFGGVYCISSNNVQWGADIEALISAERVNGNCVDY